MADVRRLLEVLHRLVDDGGAVLGLRRGVGPRRFEGAGRYFLDDRWITRHFMPLPDKIAIYFDEAQPPIVRDSLDQVEAELDRLHQRACTQTIPLAAAIKVFGHEIDFGLGTVLTFLCLQIDPCDGEYYLAVGTQEEGECQMFYGAGQDSYWEPKNLIPIEDARMAIRYFIEHRRRHPSLRWQDGYGRDV